MCGKRALRGRRSTDDVLVGHDFEQQHEDCNHVEEVADQLEQVHNVVKLIIITKLIQLSTERRTNS